MRGLFRAYRPGAQDADCMVDSPTLLFSFPGRMAAMQAATASPPMTVSFELSAAGVVDIAFSLFSLSSGVVRVSGEGLDVEDGCFVRIRRTQRAGQTLGLAGRSGRPDAFAKPLPKPLPLSVFQHQQHLHPSNCHTACPLACGTRCNPPKATRCSYTQRLLYNTKPSMRPTALINRRLACMRESNQAQEGNAC